MCDSFQDLIACPTPGGNLFGLHQSIDRGCKLFGFRMLSENIVRSGPRPRVETRDKQLQAKWQLIHALYGVSRLFVLTFGYNPRYPSTWTKSGVSVRNLIVCYIWLIFCSRFLKFQSSESINCRQKALKWVLLMLVKSALQVYFSEHSLARYKDNAMRYILNKS